MTSISQRAALQAQIWKIANEVRGAVDGWDFKQFVLGTLFYRFISENFTNYIEGGDSSVNYAGLPDSVITPEIKDDAIESSASGYESEDNRIDLFGDACEFLINNYAANAGKSGGEFFTPQNVSGLIARLAMHKQASVNKIYDPTLINDDRFAPAGVLAPKSKADFAFVLHSLSYLSGRGRAAIVCFPGIFYRGGAEQKIRKYLVDNNYVETIISLPPNLFYGTSIAVNILVLSKHKEDNMTQFIDASGEDFFKKETNNNVLEDEHIERIMSIFDSKEDVDYVAKSVDNSLIADNDYNLSVSSYVEAEDTRPQTDIRELNARIRRIVARENELRTEIDRIIAELEEE